MDGVSAEALIEVCEDWPIILPEQKMSAHSIHEFVDEVDQHGPITHIRLNIFPDGGISRLRLFGKCVKPA